MTTTSSPHSTPSKKNLNRLDQLKQFTKVVADTGDFESIREYEPLDATTNPSLILNATQKEEYRHLLDKAVADNRGQSLSPEALAAKVLDDLLVLFGREILQIIPGRVSTETHARLSFDTEGSVEKGRHLIALYEAAGVPRERILIKIASTWEGIRAAEILQKEGIRCNMTLLFSLCQAVACAEAGAQLISPFVGRIYDWYKKDTGKEYEGAEDPGVQSVRQIYTYYKKFGYDTEVMGASFRKASQIVELAGCDLLTISPDLLKELKADTAPIERKLNPEAARTAPVEKIVLDEKTFRYQLNDDAMACEKTAEGIRRFAADAIKLETIITKQLAG